MKKEFLKQASDTISKNGLQVRREENKEDVLEITTKREPRISRWQSLKISLKLAKRPEIQIITIRVWLWEEKNRKNFQLIFPPNDFENLIGNVLNELEKEGWNILVQEHTVKRGRPLE